MTTRIGVLTLHLHINYGGIVQAAALYRLLQNYGFEPVLLRKEPQRSFVSKIARTILRSVPGQNFRNVRSGERARAKHYDFINRFLPERTGPLENAGQLARAVASRKLDAVVVGSDQVWRLEYHQDDNNMVYFLDFVTSAAVKKISYAASFGTSEWTHPDKRDRVTELLGHFDAVSARERSGVTICRETLGRADCQLVVDPTLLVDPAFYTEAAALPGATMAPTVLTYLLDQSETRLGVGETVKATLGNHYRIRALSPYGAAEKVSIPVWLRAFMDADFVVTDSYHGTIFAIISRKNFIAIGNPRRGLDRFLTLLGELGLEDRLVMDDGVGHVADLAKAPIDFDRVNTRLEALRMQSSKFLLTALGRADAPSAPTNQRT